MNPSSIEFVGGPFDGEVVRTDRFPSEMTRMTMHEPDPVMQMRASAEDAQIVTVSQEVVYYRTQRMRGDSMVYAIKGVA